MTSSFPIKYFLSISLKNRHSEQKLSTRNREFTTNCRKFTISASNIKLFSSSAEETTWGGGEGEVPPGSDRVKATTWDVALVKMSMFRWDIQTVTNFIRTLKESVRGRSLVDLSNDTVLIAGSYLLENPARYTIYNTIQNNTNYNAIQYSTIQYNTTYNTIQYNTTYSTIQHTIQHNRVQYNII